MKLPQLLPRETAQGSCPGGRLASSVNQEPHSNGAPEEQCSSVLTKIIQEHHSNGALEQPCRLSLSADWTGAVTVRHLDMLLGVEDAAVKGHGVRMQRGFEALQFGVLRQ